MNTKHPLYQWRRQSTPDEITSAQNYMAHLIFQRSSKQSMYKKLIENEYEHDAAVNIVDKAIQQAIDVNNKQAIRDLIAGIVLVGFVVLVLIGADRIYVFLPFIGIGWAFKGFMAFRNSAELHRLYDPQKISAR